MKISIDTKSSSNKVFLELQPIYEAFYKELPENKRYFLGILLHIQEVNLYANEEGIIDRCYLYTNEEETICVMPENLELFSKIFIRLYDEKKNK